MSALRQLAVITTVAMAGMTAAMTAQTYHLNLPAAVAQWSGSLSNMSASAAPKPAPKLANVPAMRVALAAKPSLPAQPAAPAKPAVPMAAPIVPAGVPAVVPPPAPAQPAYDPAVTAEMGQAVAERLRDTVPAGLFPYFDEYLYVSKAAGGAWAQHLYMFHKAANGDLVFEQAFPVSTGREQQEQYFTSTPTGMFELDPDRFDRVHYSHRWHGAAMPWAMFLDYTIHGHATGIALHSAAGHAFELGHRASGGCVRLPPEKAEELFRRFQAEERGIVPVFAFDETRATTYTNGWVVKDAEGNTVLQDGYRVLLIIEDYPGGPAYVASLS